MAPAEVPEIPSIRSQGSSSRRSSTPQVKAPCAPPPCKAKSTSTSARVVAEDVTFESLLIVGQVKKSKLRSPTAMQKEANVTMALLSHAAYLPARPRDGCIA